ncbi:MAG: hypothetical protein ABSF61_11540 [Anaerolineales bacterium]
MSTFLFYSPPSHPVNTRFGWALEAGPKTRQKTAVDNAARRAGVIGASRIGERQEVFYILYPTAQDPSPEVPTHHG